MAGPIGRISSLGQQVLGCYRSVGIGPRLFLNARWRWTPYEQIASRVPAKGFILDLGCGHGLLSLALCLSEPERTVCGIDHEPGRVLAAQRAALGQTRLCFVTDSLLSAVAKESLRGTVAAIVVLDALHYLTFEEQDLFFAHCRQALQSDGVLLIRDVDAAAGKTFLLNRLYERAMTSVGFTRADRLHFRSGHEWHQSLARAGFDSASEPCSRFPFADLLFVARLSSSQLARAA